MKDVLFVGGPWGGQTKTLIYTCMLSVPWPQDPVVPDDWSALVAENGCFTVCDYLAHEWFGILFYAPGSWPEHKILCTLMKGYQT